MLENLKIDLREIAKNAIFKIPLFMFALTTFTLIINER